MDDLNPLGTNTKEAAKSRAARADERKKTILHPQF
jgi:hypothetical protein